MSPSTIAAIIYLMFVICHHTLYDMGPPNAANLTLEK